MSEWAETCSLAAINKPYRSSQTAQAEGEDMALHPGEAGYEDTPRNRREKLRMSDINRITEKAVTNHITSAQGDFTMASGTNQFGKVPAISPQLAKALDDWKKREDDADKATGAQVKVPGELKGNDENIFTSSLISNSAFDKNTPGSLKQLRWEIYDLIERYEGDYGKTISMTLRSVIEDLFQKYTNS